MNTGLPDTSRSNTPAGCDAKSDSQNATYPSSCSALNARQAVVWAMGMTVLMTLEGEEAETAWRAARE
jgi:hypothetical protein